MDDQISKFAQMKEAILNESPRLKESDTFQFACGKNASCFTQCCGDVNIALTPYDVVRLKNRLGITSGEFISKYCLVPFSREQKFPVVLLKMQDNERKSCFFVSEEGCGVYEDRPWACRMYPVGVASPGSDDEERFYFILQEDPCEGHGTGPTWTISSWMEDQGVEEYDLLGEEFKAISLHPFFQQGGTLNLPQMDMLFMVLYDLDKFRRFVFESSFLEKFELDETVKKEAETDDLALLTLGYRWLRFSLFGEKVLEVKEAVRAKTMREASP